MDYAKEYDRMVEQSNRLQEENDALRKDAERLNWLVERIGIDYVGGTNGSVWVPSEAYKITEEDKLLTKKAIDAAMKGQ
jgi:hypothetical protein